MQKNFFDILPCEVLLHIFAFADIKDVYNVTQTCTRFRYLLEDKRLLLSSLTNTYQKLDQNERDNLLLLHSEKVDKRSKIRVQSLLEAGANPNALDEHDGHTPLFIVSNPKIAELLAQYGADVNARFKEGFGTPLHFVSDAEIAKILLDAGADPNAVNDLGMTPLHFVSSAEIAKLLLDAGANPNAVDKYSGVPLLHRRQDKETVRVLLEAGADPNFITSRSNDTGILFYIDNLEILKMFLDAGAVPREGDIRYAKNPEKLQLLLDAKNKKFCKCLKY